MKKLRFRIESAGPLLQHDDKAANPFNEYARQMKAISSKRKKTEDDLWELARIEWVAGLYYTPEEGYYLKAECLEGAFCEAAKAKKLGKVFKEAMRIPNNPAFRFEHEELPPERLFQRKEYRDMRTVKIQRSKVLRCRPIFHQWYCEFDMWYEETRLNEQDIRDVADYAGMYIGLCDYRPKYGLFEVKTVKQIK